MALTPSPTSSWVNPVDKTLLAVLTKVVPPEMLLPVRVSNPTFDKRMNWYQATDIPLDRVLLLVWVQVPSVLVLDYLAPVLVPLSLDSMLDLEPTTPWLVRVGHSVSLS
jgi:hypothetical protein